MSAAWAPIGLFTTVTAVTLTLREQYNTRQKQQDQARTAQKIQELEEEIERLKREMRACGITVPQSR